MSYRKRLDITRSRGRGRLRSIRDSWGTKPSGGGGSFVSMLPRAIVTRTLPFRFSVLRAIDAAEISESRAATSDGQRGDTKRKASRTGNQFPALRWWNARGSCMKYRLLVETSPRRKPERRRAPSLVGRASIFRDTLNRFQRGNSIRLP
jgi:hypothetical protein